MSSYSPLVCIDFEASCLPAAGAESYPIEVGIAFVSSGASRSWLLRPTDDWMRVGFWDPAAERLHGLTIEQLQRDGLDVAAVRQELADAVGGYTIVSDYPPADALWADTLYGCRAPFQIGNYEAVLYQRVGLPPIAFRDALRDAEESALRSFPERHRAAPDARRLAQICRLMLR
jgi:hypothetical protein